MLRRWKGQLVQEGIQTGDGRIIQPDALTWDVPMPLAWIVDGTQHVDMTQEAPVIGIVDTIERAADGWITGSGWIDDQTEPGTEMIRVLEAGTASLGNRMGVSVDMDDMAIEMLGPPVQQDGVVASRRILSFTGVRVIPTPAAMLHAVAAAAGDPVPPDVEVLFEDAQDEMIMSVTRARLRGVTCVATPAFADAYLELDGDITATTASAADLVDVTLLPPAGWFADPGLDGPTRMVIDDDGRIYGHLAVWGTCHTGHQNCVTPPRGGDYTTFMSTGRVVCVDGSEAGTGALVWGIQHASLTLPLLDAFAHYEVAEHGFADVRVGEDDHGIWFAGVLRPHITEADLRTLRALSVSGDWHRRDGRLDMIAGLAVNYPGFPIGDSVAASAADLRVDDDLRVLAMVAAGVIPAVAGGSCSTTAMDMWRAAVDAKLDMLIGRSVVQIPGAVAAAAGRIPNRR